MNSELSTIVNAYIENIEDTRRYFKRFLNTILSFLSDVTYDECKLLFINLTNMLNRVNVFPKRIKKLISKVKDYLYRKMIKEVDPIETTTCPNCHQFTLNEYEPFFIDYKYNICMRCNYAV